MTYWYKWWLSYQSGDLVITVVSTGDLLIKATYDLKVTYYMSQMDKVVFDSKWHRHVNGIVAESGIGLDKSVYDSKWHTLLCLTRKDCSTWYIIPH